MILASTGDIIGAIMAPVVDPEVGLIIDCIISDLLVLIICAEAGFMIGAIIVL